MTMRAPPSRRRPFSCRCLSFRIRVARLAAACAAVALVRSRARPCLRRRRRRRPATSSLPTPTSSSRASRRCRRASPAPSRATPTSAAIGSSTGTRRGARCSSRIAGRRRHDADLPHRRPARRARAADRRRRAGVARPATSRSTATTSSSSAAAAATRRRSSIASTSRPADDAPHRARRAPRHAGLAASLEPAALPLGAARPHRARRPSRRDRADALADGPAASRRRGVASPSCPAAAGRSSGVSWDDTTVALTRYVSALRVGGLAARSRDRRRRRQVLPAPGSSAGEPLRRGVEARRLGLLLRQRSRRRVPRADVLSPRRRAGSTVDHAAASRGTSTTSASTRAAACSPCAPTSKAATSCASSTPTPSTSCRRRGCPTAASPTPISIRACRRSPSPQEQRGPGTIAVVDPADGARAALDDAVRAAGRRHGRRSASSQIVRWKSFDGREISGLLSTPPARFAGKRPVLVDIHGGPESQAQLGFLGRYNYFLERARHRRDPAERARLVGLRQDLPRRSTTACKREDSVKDIGALLDWIAHQPGLDAGAGDGRRAAATAAT